MFVMEQINADMHITVNCHFVYLWRAYLIKIEVDKHWLDVYVFNDITKYENEYKI